MEELKARLEDLEASQIDGYLIPQLGTLHLAQGTEKSIVADAPLNTFNRHSLEILGDLGAETVTLSPELRFCPASVSLVISSRMIRRSLSSVSFILLP